MDNTETLTEYRDKAGRLKRVYADGREVYVCDWSGREHTMYLIPWQVPDFEKHTTSLCWIDKQTWREWIREARAHRENVGTAILNWVLGRFFGRL